MPATPPAPKAFAVPPPAWTLLLAVVCLGFFWAILINQLRVEWTLDPQYGYGWSVPVLLIYLLARTHPGPAPVAAAATAHKRAAFAGFLGLALCFLGTRFLQEANPYWRLVSWALAGEVVGITLLLIYFALGPAWLRRLAFPIIWFLVAVPWPHFLEDSLIQGLTREDARVTVQLLDWLRIPALPHGNVIEVATGNVGVDEACSGIRSLQATLMISLFLGELYRLPVPGRLVLALAGLVLSLAFNLVRMALLVWLAARDGVAAIAKWHDPAGVTILLACFFALRGLGLCLARKKNAVAPPPMAPRPKEIYAAPPGLVWLLLALPAWTALSEFSVSAWYRWHEQRLAPPTTWTVRWPTNNPSFLPVTLADNINQRLRYDAGQSVTWSAEGIAWQAVFLQWRQGTIVPNLLNGHTPAICMRAAGHPLTLVEKQVMLEAAGLQLPFSLYAVANSPEPAYLFYCLWDDHNSVLGRPTVQPTFHNRLANAWQGVRHQGERSLEIVLVGNLDAAQAQAAMRNQLGKLVQAEIQN